MYRPAKQADQELLQAIGLIVLELKKHIDKSGIVDLLEKYAQDYATLKEKLETHDYSKQDEILIRSFDRKLKI